MLQFKGKAFVQNHHFSVPVSELKPDEKKSLLLKGEKPSLEGNLIIHGDNLKALKALLPTYAGRVKCIYIDPPYNTGNEHWKYNDNVNSPMIQSWLGQEVKIDDLSRHDKWLCMMMPRLKLLRELLSDDGVIFISIDDNEVHHLRALMNEIFFEDNFVASLIRQAIKGGTGPSDEVRKTHDYVLVYAKNKEESELSGLEVDSLPLDQVDNVGAYRKGRELNKWGAGSRREDSPTMWFPITGPQGEDVYPIRNDGSEGRWRWGKKRMLKAVENENVIFEARTDGTCIVYEKIREDSVRRKAHSTLELTNASGTETLKALFGGKSPFPYPKPVSLVEFLIDLVASEDGAIVLDSFAGSGTTAHAVLAKAKEDENSRRFILIECEDYADMITAERVRRVIKGLPHAKDPELKKGLGGGFSYFTLGNAIDANAVLTGKSLPSYEEMARFVFYSATGAPFDAKKINKKKGYIGESEEYEVYLLYKPDVEFLKTKALDADYLKVLGKAGKKTRLVFGPMKYLDQEALEEHKIIFAQLPSEIYRR